jgi:hypothetical protein
MRKKNEKMKLECEKQSNEKERKEVARSRWLKMAVLVDHHRVDCRSGWYKALTWRLPPAGARRARGRGEATTAAEATALATSEATTEATLATTVASSAVATLATALVTTSRATKAAALLAGVTATTSAAATSAATATRAVAATAEGALLGDVDEPLGNLLVGLLEELNELATEREVVAVEEGSRGTSVTGTTGTTDTVSVLSNVGGEVVQDNVGDVGNVETTSSDGSGDKNGGTASTECLEGSLTLTLSTVTVNGGGVVALRTEEVTKRVGHALSLNEDEDKTSGLLGKEKVKEKRTLVLLVDVLDALGNVLRSGANTTDREEDVVLEEAAGEHLDLLGEGRREHEGLTVMNTGHVLTLNNTTDLGLETHVKHAVSLVEDEVLDVGKRDTATLNQVDKTTGGSREKVTTAVELADLLTNVGTTVDDGRANPRTVGELAGLLVNLRDELTGGGKNKTSGVGLAARVAVRGGVRGRSRGTVGEGGRENGEEETTSLTRTSLGTSHEVTTKSDDGDRVLLDGGGGAVTGHGNVLKEDRVNGRAELGYGLGNASSSGLDGNVGILVEVDTSRLLMG